MAAKVRNYRRFLLHLEDELAEALREAEAFSWHHERAGSIEALHYGRLCTWLKEIHDRMEWYDNVHKGSTKVGRKTKSASPEGGVVRHHSERNDDDR